jgi:beta-fructofuranosidase
MAVGAGTTGRRPAVLQYSSADLRTWRPDGVLAEPAPGPDGPGGAVWECPQLFPLDGAWVLLVSVWDDGPAHVAYAVGNYDGRRFTARSWRRLADDACYAATAFADAGGRRCALAWVRGVAGPDWAGALTVPWLLGREGDRLTFSPHPDVDTLRTGVPADAGPAVLSAGTPLTVPVGRHADVLLRADPGVLEVALDASGGGLLAVTVEPSDAGVRVSAPDQADVRLPLPPGARARLDLRLLVDSGLVEVFCGGEVAVARVPGADGERRLTVGGDGARLRQLRVHGMERLTG